MYLQPVHEKKYKTAMTESSRFSIFPLLYEVLGKMQKYTVKYRGILKIP